MGTTYVGPYFGEIDTYDHEGYTARVMPDGVETSTFGGQYGWDGHIGYRAGCECGWSGTTVYPVPDLTRTTATRQTRSGCANTSDPWSTRHGSKPGQPGHDVKPTGPLTRLRP